MFKVWLYTIDEQVQPTVKWYQVGEFSGRTDAERLVATLIRQGESMQDIRIVVDDYDPNTHEKPYVVYRKTILDPNTYTWDFLERFVLEEEAQDYVKSLIEHHKYKEEDLKIVYETH